MKITDYIIEIEPTRILIDLENGQTVIADLDALIETDENAVMFLNDPFYYKGSIRVMCEKYLEEVKEEDYIYL
jgi:hypothetical protein